jgi:hypothetical protein
MQLLDWRRYDRSGRRRVQQLRLHKSWRAPSIGQAILLWVNSGCTDQAAARQVNPNKRTPELEQTYLA